MAQLVSILINNCNYAEYVGQAIDSALAQTHPDVEVVVVDDGSTDDSRSVLAGYADRILVVEQENAGQPVAAAAALEASRGDIVLFLDADDFLAPEAAARLAAVWEEGCSKVQFRLSLVDRGGKRIGADPPAHVPMPTGDLVPEIAATGWYETPVTSGNAYPRGLLERLFPVPPEFRYIDPYLNTVAPFYGRVISIEEELGAYRLHGDNGWAFTGGVDMDGLRDRVREALMKERYIDRLAATTGRRVPRGTALRNPAHVLQRLASLRLDRSAHPVSDDTVGGLLRAGFRALRAARHLPPPDRALYAGTLLITATGPQRMVSSAVEFTFLSRPRPAWMRAAARTSRRVLARISAVSPRRSPST